MEWRKFSKAMCLCFLSTDDSVIAKNPIGFNEILVSSLNEGPWRRRMSPNLRREKTRKTYKQELISHYDNKTQLFWKRPIWIMNRAVNEKNKKTKSSECENKICKVYTSMRHTSNRMEETEILPWLTTRSNYRLLWPPRPEKDKKGHHHGRGKLF